MGDPLNETQVRPIILLTLIQVASNYRGEVKSKNITKFLNSERRKTKIFPNTHIALASTLKPCKYQRLDIFPTLEG